MPNQSVLAPTPFFPAKVRTRVGKGHHLSDSRNNDNASNPSFKTQGNGWIHDFPEGVLSGVVGNGEGEEEREVGVSTFPSGTTWIV